MKSPLFFCTIWGLILLVSVPSVNAQNQVNIFGRVTDMSGVALHSVSVTTSSYGSAPNSTITDEKGSFILELADVSSWSVRIEFSSIGYNEEVIVIVPYSPSIQVDVVLKEKPVKLEGISVKSIKQLGLGEAEITREEIIKRSEYSLIATNPIASLRTPLISKAGSAHSSQIRIQGTSPEYYVNGQSVSTNPTHFGFFGTVPSTAIDNITFHSLGTPAEFGRPSVVELTSLKPFGEKTSGNLLFSPLELGGLIQITGNHWFVLGSLRKSMLDLIVNKFNIADKTGSIPPASFRDFYEVVGIRISETISFEINHSRSSDSLHFNTASLTDASSGIDIFESSQDEIFSLRLKILSSHLLTHAQFGIRSDRRSYRALFQGSFLPDEFYVDLQDKSQVGSVGVNFEFSLKNYEIETGVQSEIDFRRKSTLNQHNWNFLPPYANTDQASVYQDAINKTYGNHTADRSGKSHAVFLSVVRNFQRITIQTGMRFDRFSQLRGQGVLSYRIRTVIKTSDNSSINLSSGAYSQSPLDNILEPFQVMVRADLENLFPIRTYLHAAVCSKGLFEIGVFVKRTSNLPIVFPDFNASNNSGSELIEDVIFTQSIGRANFKGGFLTVDSRNGFYGKLGIWVSYMFERAHREENGIDVKHELDSPHRFEAQIDYLVKPQFRVGATAQIRSGYPFTPIREVATTNESSVFQESYYLSVLSQENTDRFSANAIINLNGSYAVGKMQLLLAVFNVTNRSNPIIQSSRGIVYDAGILPMIALTYSF